MLFWRRIILHLIRVLLPEQVKHVTAPFLSDKGKVYSPAAFFSEISPHTVTGFSGKRVHLFPSCRASLTVETSVVLPVFMICMLSVSFLCRTMGSSVMLGEALSVTAQEMAVGAGMLSSGEEATAGGRVLTVAAARAGTLSRAGDMAGIKDVSFLLSALGSDPQTIDLTVTFRPAGISGLITFPGIVFTSRAVVRNWTGREGSSLSGGEPEEHHSHRSVYVTEHGTVYHTDKNCSHIHLSIQKVQRSRLKGLRNTYGEKYHVCEHCHGGTGDTVYITSDGNRYHSSLDCSGLKRTVSEISEEDAAHLRPCSRCAGGGK